MSDEIKSDPPVPEASSSEGPSPPQWEQKSEFAVVGHMKEAIRATMSATESEIAALQRKLERLQYGS